MINIFIYLIYLIIAGLISVEMYSLCWWSPAILFPLISYLSYGSNYFKIKIMHKYILQAMNAILSFGFVGVQGYIFYINMDWYGIIIGIVVGYLGVPFIVHEIWRWNRKR